MGLLDYLFDPGTYSQGGLLSLAAAWAICPVSGLPRRSGA
jgi:hypothetical protein